jgi:elongation factor Ts
VAAQITAAQVKELRDETGAGMMDCKRALAESGGDLGAAKDLLRRWGVAGVAKRAARAASEGIVASYLHQLSDMPPRVGALVELNCETDFVAKTDDFRQLARDIAVHVAAMAPRWIKRDDVPQDYLDQELKRVQADMEWLAGEVPHVAEREADHKLSALLGEAGGVLLEQPFVKDPSKTVGDLIGEVAAGVKENVVVRRICRFRIGEE